MSRFVWYELMTDRMDAVRDFYGAVIGWEIGGPEPSQAGGPFDYRMITRADGGNAGGILALTDDMTEMGATPSWQVYLRVDDVAETLAAIVADGGHVLVPPTTIQEGTFGLVADPQGVPFYVMKPTPPSGDVVTGVFSPDRPQWASWQEYGARDLDAAKAFYARHFGFAFEHSMPMGLAGDYWFIGDGEQTVGGFMAGAAASDRFGWTVYFRVADIRAAHAAITAHGGTVLTGLQEVPGSDLVAIATDPQGARFGIVGTNPAHKLAQQQVQQQQ